MRIVSFFFILLTLCACGKIGEGESTTTYIDKQSEGNLKVLYTSMKSMEFEVVYEPEAEPYVGNRFGGKPYWGLLEENVKAIFSEREGDYTLTVPKTLEQMRAIPDQAKTTWTVDELLSLQSNYRQTVHSGTQASVFVAFVNGHLIQNGAENPSVLGVSIAGTTMVAIFKDVIKSAESSGMSSAKFMEQSTLVHEFGHVVGLVDNGLSMNSSHVDSEHGHHCNNSQCVMYWKNEGKSDLFAFVQQFILSGNTVMFDQNCLDDAKNYAP